LEVVVAFVGFLLALLVVRRPWLRNVLECSPELVALVGCVIAIQMPCALLFEKVSEAAGGLFGVVLRRALYSRDCVVWLALEVRTRVVVVVVVVATPLILVVVVAAHIVLALAANGVILGVHLVLFVGRC
jgi:hypothetical protein